MATSTAELHVATRSDVGPVCSNNQDSGYTDTNLLILVDGMGGPVSGDIVSSVTLAHLVPLDTDTHTASPMLVLLYDALIDAHSELSECSRRNLDLEGLGTTCIAIMCSGNKLVMVHIGNSRAYIPRGVVPTQAATDRSFTQRLVRTGQIILEEAEHHPNRNVVSCILGDSQADVTPDETTREAVLGDCWLLYSDGLSRVVSLETISSVLAEIKDPGQCAEELIRLVLCAGGPDNVICVAADIVNSGSFPPAPLQIAGAVASDRNAAPCGGSSTVTRVAALRNKKGSDLDEDDLNLEEKRRSWFPFLITALVTLVFAVASRGGWAWAQSQYYVIGQGGYVVAHQETPQSLGLWEFSYSIEVTDIALKDLSLVNR